MDLLQDCRIQFASLQCSLSASATAALLVRFEVHLESPRERLHFDRSSSTNAPTRAWRSRHRASSRTRAGATLRSFVTPPERRATHPFIFRTSGTQTRRTVFLNDTPSSTPIDRGRLKCSPQSHGTTSLPHLAP